MFSVSNAALEHSAERRKGKASPSVWVGEKGRDPWWPHLSLAASWHDGMERGGCEGPTGVGGDISGSHLCILVLPIPDFAF